MLEKLADYDDALMEQLLSDIDPPKDLVFDDLARELREGHVVPVLMGSATEGHGVTRLLKAVRHEAPAIGHTRNRLGIDDAGPALGQVFRTVHTAHGGKLSLSRVLRGAFADGATVINSHGVEERIGGLARLTGASSAKVNRAEEGDTIAFARLEKPRHRRPFFRRQERSRGRRASTASAADPGLRDQGERPQGRGAACGRPRQALRGGPRAILRPGRRNVRDEALRPGRNASEGDDGAPRRPFRRDDPHPQADMWPIARPSATRSRCGAGTRSSQADTASSETSSSRSVHAVVARASPSPSGCTAARCRDNISPRSKRARRTPWRAGRSAFPVVDVSVTLTDGSYHTVDLSDMAFRAAARIALDEALAKARPVLLEPILSVTIYVPSDALARASALVSARRGQILGFECARGLEGLGSPAGAHPRSGDWRPHHRTEIGDRRRGRVRDPVRPSCGAHGEGGGPSYRDAPKRDVVKSPRAGNAFVAAVQARSHRLLGGGNSCFHASFSGDDRDGRRHFRT